MLDSCGSIGRPFLQRPLSFGLANFSSPIVRALDYGTVKTQLGAYCWAEEVGSCETKSAGESVTGVERD